MDSPLADQIVETMQNKTTGELLEIWTANDSDQWSDTAFEVIHLILSERNVSIPPQKAPLTSSPIPQRYKGVRGWLLFFCISLTVFSPLSLIASLGKSTTSDMFHDFRPVFVIQEILGFILSAPFIYVGVCLWRVSPGAVRKARVLLWCVLVLDAVIAIMMYLAGSLSSNNGGQIAAGVIAPLVWLAYLDNSKRMKATYGL